MQVGDAQALELPDGIADLVVCSLALIAVDDPPRRCARPRASCGPAAGTCSPSCIRSISAGDAGVSYVRTHRYAEQLEDAGLRLALNDTRQPARLSTGAPEDAGPVIEALRERVPDDAHVAAHPNAARWHDKPGVLHVQALRPA